MYVTLCYIVWFVSFLEIRKRNTQNYIRRTFWRSTIGAGDVHLLCSQICTQVFTKIEILIAAKACGVGTNAGEFLVTQVGRRPQCHARDVTLSCNVPLSRIFFWSRVVHPLLPVEWT